MNLNWATHFHCPFPTTGQPFLSGETRAPQKKKAAFLPNGERRKLQKEPSMEWDPYTSNSSYVYGSPRRRGRPRGATSGRTTMPSGRQRPPAAAAAAGAAPAEKNGRSQWVVIAPASATELPKKPDSGPLFTQLRNPSTGQAALYLFSSGAHQLFELKAFHEEYRSWFIGQAVQHDGRLFFATPVDPLFLVLFYLKKAEKEQGKFQPLDQILVDEEFPSCAMLLQCRSISQSIRHIADKKEISGKKFYKYSEEKTLKWLKKKVNQTVKVLKDHGVCVGGRVHSAIFISGKEVPDATEEDYIRFAHGLLSEYFPEELSNALAQSLCLPPITPPPSEPASKKRKLSDVPVEAEEDYTKFNSSDMKNKKGNSKMSAAQKALAKVDKTGMKAISSFFSSKPKATK